MARFGIEAMRVAMHDRPDFYHLSQLEIRTRLDSELMTSAFLLLDENTAATNGVWYVQDTEECHRSTEGAAEAGHPPVTYAGEDFTLWHMYINAIEIPFTWGAWSSGVGTMTEWLIINRNWPYDPHKSQLPPASSGINFSDPKATDPWTPARIKANFSDIEWTARQDVTSRWSSSAAVRLTAETARDNGLLQDWYPIFSSLKVDEELFMTAPYNVTSPKWSGGYPDDGRLQVLTPENGNAEYATMTNLSLCNDLRSRFSSSGSPQIQLLGLGRQFNQSQSSR